MSSRSGEASCELLYSVYLTVLLPCALLRFIAGSSIGGIKVCSTTELRKLEFELRNIMFFDGIVAAHKCQTSSTDTTTTLQPHHAQTSKAQKIVMYFRLCRQSRVFK